MLLLQVNQPFGREFHALISEVLGDERELQWDLQVGADRAAGGATYQLRQAAKAESIRFQLLTASCVERVADEVAKLADLASSRRLRSLVPQLFPVRMTGNVVHPPFQTPHQDNHLFDPWGQVCPEYTFVYYVCVNECIGGELVLFDSTGFEVERISPNEADLVGLPGDQWHAVTPLVEGKRVSLVLNFYDPPAAKRVSQLWPGGDRPYY